MILAITTQYSGITTLPHPSTVATDKLVEYVIELYVRNLALGQDDATAKGNAFNVPRVRNRISTDSYFATKFDKKLKELKIEASKPVKLDKLAKMDQVKFSPTYAADVAFVQRVNEILGDNPVLLDNGFTGAYQRRVLANKAKLRNDGFEYDQDRGKGFISFNSAKDQVITARIVKV